LPSHTSFSLRDDTVFRALVKKAGDEEAWTLLSWTVAGRTQDEGKHRAADRLDTDPAYSALIRGEGMEIAVTASRAWKPQRFGSNRNRRKSSFANSNRLPAVRGAWRTSSRLRLAKAAWQRKGNGLPRNRPGWRSLQQR
jgi:hypothetical protein